MNEFVVFLQSLSMRVQKLDQATAENAAIMKRSILADIAIKRAQVDKIDSAIRDVLDLGELSTDDRLDMEMHLYNCDTFRDLSDSVVQQIKQQ